MKEVDINSLRREWTPEQLAEALELTKKRMNLYKLLAVITFFCGGIGLILPFGKLAQLYTIGYAELQGKNASGAGWAFLGLLMSLVMVSIAKVFPSLIYARIIYPKN